MDPTVFIDTIIKLQDNLGGISELKRSPAEQIMVRLDAEGAMNLTQLAKARNISKATICVQLEQMVSEALIIKARSKYDGRQTVYLLSRKGRQALARKQQLEQSAVIELMSDIETNEWHHLLKQLSQMNDRIEARNESGNS